MLKSWTPGEMPDREEMKIQLEKTKSSLYDLQMKIKEHKLPVLVLFEGWSAAGVKPVSYFDTFVKEWYEQGGEELTEQIRRSNPGE